MVGRQAANNKANDQTVQTQRLVVHMYLLNRFCCDAAQLICFCIYMYLHVARDGLGAGSGSGSVEKLLYNSNFDDDDDV